jgi:hypothetical protein
MNRISYASSIESNMCAMMSTRSDMSYALSIINRCESDLGESH